MRPYALDIGSINDLRWASQTSLHFPNARGDLAELAVGDAALLIGADVEEKFAYCAIAIVRETRSEYDGLGLVIHLHEINWFGNLVTADKPDGPWLRLEAEQFAAIAANGQSREIDSAFEESMQVPFQEHPSIEIYGTIWDRVMLVWGGMCAMTGKSGPDVQPCVIQPMPYGGRHHVGNMIALCEMARDHFANYEITIGPDWQFIVDIGAIAPELLEALHPIGRLRVSPDEASRPDQRYLAWHREQFFARLA